MEILLSSSFFKLILQLESNTLYRGSNTWDCRVKFLFTFFYNFFFLSLNLDYIFHFSINLFWMYTFLFYIGGSKVKCKRWIITTKCNCVYLFIFMKDCVYILVHTSLWAYTHVRAQMLFYFLRKKLIIYINYNLGLLHFPTTKISKCVMKKLFHPQTYNTHHMPRYFCDWKM